MEIIETKHHVIFKVLSFYFLTQSTLSTFFYEELVRQSHDFVDNLKNSVNGIYVILAVLDIFAPFFLMFYFVFGIYYLINTEKKIFSSIFFLLTLIVSGYIFFSGNILLTLIFN